MAESKAVVYETIEKLKTKFKISNAVFAGVKAANGWRSGKQVTQETFEKACDSFLNAAIDGRAKEAKG